MKSKASGAATETLKIMAYTLDNNRSVASSRIVKAAVLVALSEISNICQNWSSVARHRRQRFLLFQRSYRQTERNSGRIRQ